MADDPLKPPDGRITPLPDGERLVTDHPNGGLRSSVEGSPQVPRRELVNTLEHVPMSELPWFVIITDRFQPNAVIKIVEWDDATLTGGPRHAPAATRREPRGRAPSARSGRS